MNQGQTDLSKFNNEWYKPGASFLRRGLWYLFSACFFKSAFPFYAPKRFFLRLFGARIGSHVVIKPHVSIKYPWKLVVEDHVWIGEQVWIDNLATVTLKKNSCVSQGAMLLCGNHNYRKSTFDLVVREITLEEGAWAGARSVVCPGVILGSHSLLTVGSVATSNLDPYWLYQGNPAIKLKERRVL